MTTNVVGYTTIDALQDAGIYAIFGVYMYISEPIEKLAKNTGSI